ncbi:MULTISPECIES: hypothetical protein [unclassified Methylobacterium]|uniref:hypothetical protein n=1 Tax=unclassified Methylobacterium TaxID=2615210 RepID=UPI0012E16F0F|nr:MULTISPECIES: hypothetical protein [unclassified Methylobacterium]
MTAKAWDHIEPDSEDAFGFIVVDEHSYKGCVIQDATDLGARLILINAEMIPMNFVLCSLSFDKAVLCASVSRTDESIDVWYDCDDCDVMFNRHDRRAT